MFNNLKLKKMKKLVLIIKIAILMFAIPVMITGQTITKEFETEPFSGVSVGDVFTVYLSQADDFSVKAEISEEQADRMSVYVSENMLRLDYDRRFLRRAERIIVYVSAPVYENIIAGGSASLKSENTLTSQQLELIASGASNTDLQVKTGNLKSTVSGAANVTLKGSATTHETSVSGASSLKAYELQTEKTVAMSSGAASLQINASKDLQANASGTSSVNYRIIPESHSFETSGAATINFKGDPEDIEDTTLEEKDQKDTVRVKIGERDLLLISDEERRRKKVVKKKPTLRNNWSGIEIGMNGYMTPDHSLSLDEEDYFLELNYPRSLSLNFNIYQQNFNLIRNNVGIFTGFGFGFINYAFDNDIRLIHHKDRIDYIDGDDLNGNDPEDYFPDGFRRNRLSLIHFNVPLMLEYQTARTRTIEQFHLSAGVIGSAKLRSYTKQVYDFDGERQRDKRIKSYHTRPFNLDATVRIGWGRVNLFATYSLFPLFRSDKGPELHPFNVGISLVNW